MGWDGMGWEYLNPEWEPRIAFENERKKGRGRRDNKVEAYSEYPLARLMFWSAAISIVSLFIPSIKIGVME